MSGNPADDHSEKICFFCVNPENNMISDILVLFQ